MFNAALFTTAKIRKQSKRPSRWMDKDVVLYTMKYYLPLKENKILPFAKTWMNPDGTMLHETSQTEKDKYYMNSFTYGI